MVAIATVRQWELLICEALRWSHASEHENCVIIIPLNPLVQCRQDCPLGLEKDLTITFVICGSQVNCLASCVDATCENAQLS